MAARTSPFHARSPNFGTPHSEDPAVSSSEMSSALAYNEAAIASLDRALHRIGRAEAALAAEDSILSSELARIDNQRANTSLNVSGGGQQSRTPTQVMGGSAATRSPQSLPPMGLHTPPKPVQPTIPPMKIPTHQVGDEPIIQTRAPSPEKRARGKPALAAAFPHPGMLETLLRTAFADADLNGRGALTLPEFKMLISRLNSEVLHLPESELRRLVAEADVNHDGTIEYDEYVPLALDLLQALIIRSEATTRAVEEQFQAREQVSDAPLAGPNLAAHLAAQLL